MSKQKLESFLTKLDGELNRSSQDYRTLTANKLTHTVTIKVSTITKTLARAVTKATNVKGDGETIIKEMGQEYKNLTKTLMTTISGNFKALQAQNPTNVKIMKGSRGGKVLKVIILEAEGAGGKQRGNFELAQNQYKEALQTFYSGFLDLLGVALERKSTSNKTGKVSQERAGQVFNLEHFKATSNIKSFVNDSIHSALVSHYSKDEYDNLESDLRKLGLKTYLEIKKNAKTGEVAVFLGSQELNVLESAGEKKLKTNLQKALKKALAKLDAMDIADLKGSDSILDVKKKKVVEKTTAPFKKVKGATVKTKTTKAKKPVGKAKINTSPVLKKGKSAKAALKKKRIAKSAQRVSPASSPLQLIGLINRDLPKAVRGNMVSPALINRTGRFANSVRVTEVVQTAQGFPSFGYTYAKSPYEVFEMGSGNVRATPERDPRKIIDQSIRQVAAQFAIGRFYTRRV